MNLPAQKCIATFDEHSISKELLQLNISRIYPFTLPVKKDQNLRNLKLLHYSISSYMSVSDFIHTIRLQTLNCLF